MGILGIIQQFRKHLSRLGYSKSTVLMLPNCLHEFLIFASKPTRAITPKDIQKYYDYLQIRPNKRRPGGLSESMINHHIFALKLFFSYQLESGFLQQNPISGMTFKRPESKPRDILTLAEIHQVYEATKTAKERAILALFYGCGLRRNEGEKLNLKDVSFKNQLLFVRSGKGGKRRAVPMSNRVRKELLNYLENGRGSSLESALILNRNGQRMRGESYNFALKEMVKRTDIQKLITLHSLRHSIATHLLESGLSIEKVRDFLGHKHLESTQIYTRIYEDI